MWHETNVHSSNKCSRVKKKHMSRFKKNHRILKHGSVKRTFRIQKKGFTGPKKSALTKNAHLR